MLLRLLFLACTCFAVALPAKADDLTFDGERITYVRDSRVWRARIDAALRGRPDWERIHTAPATIHSFRCLPPQFRRCIVVSALPSGQQRLVELDVGRGGPVRGGFQLEAPTIRAVWFDDRHLLISANSGVADTNSRGEPRLVRIWERGRPYQSAETLLALPAGGGDPEPIFDESPGGLFHAARFRLNEGTPGFVHFDWRGGFVPPPMPSGSRQVGFFQRDGLVITAEGALAAYPMQPLLNGDPAPPLRPILTPQPGERIVGVRAGRDRLYVVRRRGGTDELLALRKGRPDYNARTIHVPVSGPMTMIAASSLADMALVSRDDKLYLAGPRRVRELILPN